MSDQLLPADDPSVLAAAELIRGRRTINLFDPDTVDPAVLIDAIEVARWAPNHKLTEPWRFYLLGPETLSAASACWASYEASAKGEAAGEARRKRLAAVPGHFVVTSRRDDNPVIDLENYAASCCAMQNLMLYLWQRGVGVKWTSGAITREAGFYDVLQIDAGKERIVGYFWYGRAGLAGQQKRGSVDEIIVRKP